MRHTRLVFTLAAALLVWPACDKSNDDDQDDTTTGDTMTTDDGGSNPNASTTGDNNTNTSGNTTDPTTTDESSTTDETGTGDKDCDFGCNLYMDDCPVDQRCTSTVCDPEGGSSWDTASCVPIGEKSWGEECRAPFEPDVTPEETCGKGLMCWNICRNICIGSKTEPRCADPNELCLQGNEGALAACHTKCDPFTPDCTDTEVCLPAGESPQGFVCIGKSGEPSEGNYGEICQFINSCRQGLACVEAGRVDAAGCESDYCCTTMCDLENPECQGEKEMCEPMLDQSIPGYENVGVCVIPVSD